MRWLIHILILLLIMNIAFATKLKVNEYTEVDYKNVTLLGVGTDSIKVSVNDQGAILKKDETKVINGIKITVLEIFYAGDKEIDYADIAASSIYVCGDDKCDEEEKDSCCTDCGCQKGYECDENKCRLIIIPECTEDKDCDDNDETTQDECKKNKCYNTFHCTKNSQCEDNNECTKDYCEDETCFNEDISGCGVEEPKIEEKTEEKQELTEEVKEIKEETEEIPQEEKKGFFSRLFGFFKKLFSGRLFVN